MWHRVRDAVTGAQQSLVRTGLKSRQRLVVLGVAVGVNKWGLELKIRQDTVAEAAPVTSTSFSCMNCGFCFEDQSEITWFSLPREQLLPRVQLCFLEWTAMCEQPLVDHGQDVKACLGGLDLTEAELESDLMHLRTDWAGCKWPILYHSEWATRLDSVKQQELFSQCFSQLFLKMGSLSDSQPQIVLCTIAFHLQILRSF